VSFAPFVVDTHPRASRSTCAASSGDVGLR